MFRKGETYRFISSGNQIEIIKGSNDPLCGMVKLRNWEDEVVEYSCDYLNRQLNFGFLEKISDEN